MQIGLRITLILMMTVNVYAEVRTWTLRSGREVEAEYVKMLFDNVVLRNPEGVETKIPLTDLSDQDATYIELLNPPELDVDFRDSFKQMHVSVSPYMSHIAPPVVKYYRFGAAVKQVDTKPYTRELTLDVYAFTRQKYDPDKYHMIARLKSKPFTLNAANGRSYEFLAPQQFKTIDYYLIVDFLAWEEVRGEELAESLVIVRDERGEVIAYNSSKKWLIANLDQLEALPVGAWLDKTCARVHPTSPKDTKSGIPPS